MGYMKLSGFMADEHYPIFRQFQQSAIRDLLYLQAELVHLESEYHQVAKADLESGELGERQHYAYEWWHLSQSEERGFGGEQWALALQIRSKLQAYYAALLQYAQVSSLNKPKSSEIAKLRAWIESPHLGGGCRFLGKDLGGFVQPTVYDPLYKEDLVLLVNNHGEDDALTRFLSGPVLRAFHIFWRHLKAPVPLPDDTGSDSQSGLYHYSDAHVHSAINIIGTVASSLAPMVSIVVLYVIQSTAIRLGLVCVFTLLFSFTLALATKARRIEVFAATAAFASVQVVFVGSVGNIETGTAG